jgi:hypothetical protein
MVVLEKPTQPFSTADSSVEVRRWLVPRREQQHVAFALVIALMMKVRQVLAKHTPQRSLFE